MLKINRKISRYNHYKGNNPKYIVIHYVGAQSSTAKNNATYFYTGNRNASAHFFVDDTSIWQSVEIFNGAWHCGDTNTAVNNKNSIGIEQCCLGAGLQVTEKTENNAIELVVYLMKKYNIPIENVRTHHEVSGKMCPNWSANNWARWKNFKKKVVAQLNPAKPKPTKPTIMYRVRKTWKDVKSQVSAFLNKNSAIDSAKKAGAEYEVYDEKGNVVWAHEKPVTIKVGSKIKIKGSKWATGQTIPSWCKNKEYIVKGVSGNKLLLADVMSWVYSKDVTLVRDNSFLVQITASALNIRKGGSTSHLIVGKVFKGQVYTIVEEKNGWGRLKSGAGWISLSSAYVKRL